jgi:glycosyltransferase involved in cell wall biosynthesis
MKETGLILVGSDDEGILDNIEGENIFRLGPVYGEESLELLSASDVYCLPGAIGLSIVDAFYCGLPVVTENVVHGPEIMYLKDGVNGFMIPKGNITQLAAKLKMLLTDGALRERFSQAARNEIMTNGHIDRMCEGFRRALEYVCT